jgi:IS30 family transposase
MDRRYKHLNGEERGVVFAEHRRGASLRAIGSLLGRHASTISRELRRGRGDDDHYSPEASRRGYDARRLRSRRPCRLVEGNALYIWVRGKLEHLRWSPEQIAGRLRAMHPDNPDRRVSHETIYAAIYAQPRGGLKAAMIEALRQRKPARGRRRTTLAGPPWSRNRCGLSIARKKSRHGSCPAIGRAT